jgi:GntR family transcriptional regulator
MFFSINPSNGLAIYEQVVRQITFAVASGSLLPGDLVPSVREMARELAINPNTVARAYRELQTAGVLDAQRGLGLAVAADAARGCLAARRELVRARLHEVLAEGRRSGLGTTELRQLIDAELASLPEIDHGP